MRSSNFKQTAVSTRYADFVRSITDWVWETDPNLNFTYLSDGVAQVFGFPAQMMVGKYLFALNHFRHVDKDLQDIVAQIDERRPFRNRSVGRS